MNATVSMDALYTFLKSLSLGSDNERWLGEKLIEDAEDAEYISKEEILAGIGQGLKEMQERKRSGKKAMTLDELIDEL